MNSSIDGLKAHVTSWIDYFHAVDDNIMQDQLKVQLIYLPHWHQFTDESLQHASGHSAGGDIWEDLVRPKTGKDKNREIDLPDNLCWKNG